jgi:hypothetical protein
MLIKPPAPEDIRAARLAIVAAMGSGRPQNAPCRVGTIPYQAQGDGPCVTSSGRTVAETEGRYDAVNLF